MKKEAFFEAIRYFVLGALIISSYLFLYQATLTNREVGRQNQTYTRFTACALPITVEERTQARIDQCWEAVQKDTGVQVTRYDKEL